MQGFKPKDRNVFSTFREKTSQSQKNQKAMERSLGLGGDDDSTDSSGEAGDSSKWAEMTADLSDSEKRQLCDYLNDQLGSHGEEGSEEDLEKDAALGVDEEANAADVATGEMDDDEYHDHSV